MMKRKMLLTMPPFLGQAREVADLRPVEFMEAPSLP